MTVGVLSGCGNASEPAESTAGSATVGSVTTNSRKHKRHTGMRRKKE